MQFADIRYALLTFRIYLYIAKSKTDGGGIRGYWSLLALNRLMEYVAEAERDPKFEDEEPHDHSFVPERWPSNVTHFPTKQEAADLEALDSHEEEYTALIHSKRYLPCHYFDYIGGSSTGG